MKTNKLTKNLIMVAVALLPLLYMFIIWDTIPVQVPLHFDGQMKPNRFGSKTEFFLSELLLAGISIFTYFLLQYIYLIDPKRRGVELSKTFDKLSSAVVIFLTGISLMTIIASTRNAEILRYAMWPMIGLLFAFLGNYMHNIKPNYFAGIRTPWALNDDNNWRKTHQLAGIMFFVGGLVITTISLVVPIEVAHIIIISIIVVLVLVPYLYSFILFKRSGNTEEHISNL